MRRRGGRFKDRRKCTLWRSCFGTRRRFGFDAFVFKNLQKPGLVCGQSCAQFFVDGASRRVNHETIVAGSFYFYSPGAQLREQFVGCHISITSRSVSNDGGVVGGRRAEEASDTETDVPSEVVAHASMACLIKGRGTLRSVSLCIRALSGPMAAGSRKSISASTEARRTSGEESPSAPTKWGVASRSCTKLRRRAAAARSLSDSATRRSRVASSKYPCFMKAARARSRRSGFRPTSADKSSAPTRRRVSLSSDPIKLSSYGSPLKTFLASSATRLTRSRRPSSAAATTGVGVDMTGVVSYLSSLSSA